MHWLTNLLGVKTPDDTHLQSAELGFRGMLSWWLLVPVVVLLVALVFLLYFREHGRRLGPVRRSLLAILRVAVLVFVLLLMFRPVLLAEFKGQRPRGIVLLVDNTQSMKQADRRMSMKDQARVAIANGLLEPGADLEKSMSIADLPKDPARVDLVKSVLGNNKLKLLDGLKKHGPIRPYLFGEKLYSVVEETGEGKSADLSSQLTKLLDASQDKTAVADHILDILTKKEGDLPAAIVLMTDGLANADHVPLIKAAEECARLKVPLYIYGVGSTEGGILQITDLHVPPTVLYEDKVTIPIHYRAQGFKKGMVQITMKLGDQVVGVKEYPVQNGEDLREEMVLMPKKVQAEKNKDNKLSVTVELKDNPLFKDTAEEPVFISDKKLKVLYIENAPRWEYKFLEPMLVREEQEGRMEARFILVQADPERTKQLPFLPAFPPREELFKYDLIILGDVPESYLGKKNLKLIEEFVRDFRGGLIVIAGEVNMPGGYNPDETDSDDSAALARLLPVKFLPKKNQPNPDDRPVAYTPVLTKAGETSGMLDLTGAEDEGKEPSAVPGKDRKKNVEIWRNLPGFFWSYDLLTKLRPGASSLLVHPRKKMGKEPMPILATHFYGGQVMFMATDETWRWRKNEENKYFAQFWGQIIYQFALPHHLGDASKKVKMTLEQSEAILNRKGYIYLRMLDEKFTPVDKESVPAKVTQLNTEAGPGKTMDVEFKKVPGHLGEYRLLFPHDQEGRFEIKVPGTDYSFQYQVKVPPRHEQEKAPLAEDILSQAAQLSGGAYYREEDLHRMAGDVKEQKTPFALHQEILLWNPLVLVIFILLIATEWILRKFANLS